MRDISYHLLDLAMNSIRANCTALTLMIDEQQSTNQLTMTLSDNGSGMDEDMIQKVMDPFFTTRTTRKVGLGIPLFKAMIERCEGELCIQSQPNQGTTLTATLHLNHIDRSPFGNIHETLVTLIEMEPTINYVYCHRVNQEEYRFDTLVIKEILQGVPINQKEVMAWIKQELAESDLRYTTY